jgi:hypothetical protein
LIEVDQHIAAEHHIEPAEAKRIRAAG